MSKLWHTLTKDSHAALGVNGRDTRTNRVNHKHTMMSVVVE